MATCGRDCGSGGRRSRGRSPTGHHPPRSEAGEPVSDRRRACEKSWTSAWPPAGWRRTRPRRAAPARSSAVRARCWGTIGYMAPEQVQGTGADARSGVFSLGCVLFEMVTGRRAFARPTATETLAAILSTPAPDVSAGGTDAPPDLGRIVARCLEKQPGQRFQSANDLSFALRALTTAPLGVGANAVGSAPAQPAPPPVRPRRRAWVLGAIAATTIVAVALAAAVWLRPGAAAKPTADAAGGLDPEKFVIAVFDNRTGDSSLDALGIQISDWTTQRLLNVDGARVAFNPIVPLRADRACPPPCWLERAILFARWRIEPAPGSSSPAESTQRERACASRARSLTRPPGRWSPAWQRKQGRATSLASWWTRWHGE